MPEATEGWTGCAALADIDEIQPLATVDERFELLELAGSGGMGEVYRAFDKVSGQMVAVKVLVASQASDRMRFEREVRLLSELQHPGIVRYVGHGLTQDGKPYLAMEWLEGENLQSRLARGKLSVEQSLAVATRVAEALAPAHARGVVHRDLKPSNIFLVGADFSKAKVLDFGVARFGDVSRMTRTGLLIGTPAYMAPEQARGVDALDPRADVFSLGCVLFECLTGSRAFAGDHLAAVLAKILFADVPHAGDLRADVPRGLDALVVRMMAKEPSIRPTDGAEVARALTALDTETDEEPYASLPPPSDGVPSLTRAERRVLSVVLLGRERPLGFDTTQTGTSTGIRSAADSLREAAETGGGRFELLADGSAVITIATGGIATDQAAQAARCALSVQALAPSRPIVLATGRGEVMGKLPMSDVIDRAVRLLTRRASSEQEGKGMWPIALDDMTAGLLDGRFEVVKRPDGFELRREHQPAAGMRTLLGKPTRCVGRERELSMLAKLFDECVEESGARAVLVTAPAGFGKSRLVQEFLRDVRKHCDTVEIWIGRGDQLCANAAFGPLGQAIRGACGIRDGDPPPIRRDKLRGRVARHLDAADRCRVADFLGELAGVPMPDDTSPALRTAQLDAELMGVEMRSAWEDFLRAECEVHPVLLVLDDLHWGDQPTLRFVEAALRSHRAQPLMVIALGRPEVQSIFPRLWTDGSVQHVRLQRLTPKASLRFVRQVLGDSVDEERAARLVAQSDGHAFYLEELIRAVAEGRGEALPEVVVAMVQARLDALEADARRVVRAASIFGEVFWQGAVDALLGGTDPSSSAGEWLASLTDREVFVRHPESRFGDEPEFSFWHELLREGAYAMLTEHDRVLGHRLAAEWLEQRVLLGDGADAMPPEDEPPVGDVHTGAYRLRSNATSAARLAEHFGIGREPARAAEWYRRAAEHALWAGDAQEASTCAERGLTLLEMLPETESRLRQELELQLHRATALTATKGYTAPEAEQAFSRAWTLCQEVADITQRVPALFGLWRVNLARGRHGTAHKFAQDLLALSAEHTHPGSVLAAHQALGMSCFFLGEIAAARKHLETVATLYDRDQNRRLTFLYGVDFEAQCLAYLSTTFWFMGLSERAVATMHRACKRAETLAHPFTLVVVLSLATNLHQVQSHIEDVHTYSERALALAQEQGFSHYALQASILQGWANALHGGPHSSVAEMHRALLARRAGRAELAMTYLLALEAEALAAAGQTREAWDVLDEALQMVDTNEERFWAAELYRLRGEILHDHHGELGISGGDLSAEDCFVQALELARKQEALTLELRAAVSLARLWASEGKGDAAAPMLSAILARFTDGAESPDRKAAEALLAREMAEAPPRS